MGGKKPRGSEPARGSSFSCRSRRGGDFRSLSQELVGAGGAVVNEVQEFSLFSCLGVREIAPWLSEENTNNDNHRSHITDIKFNRTNPSTEPDCINGDSGNYYERIKDLESVVRKMEQKLKNLEGKHKEKENTSGGFNIERFRTLEGRQAFQQSKFSSLDVAFGGTSSTVWNKGCKRLRDLLLKDEDSISPIAGTPKESTPLGLREEQNFSTSIPKIEKSHDHIPVDDIDRQSPSCVSPSTVASNSPVVKDNKRSIRTDDNSKSLQVKDFINVVESITKEDALTTEKVVTDDAIDINCRITSLKNDDSRLGISETSFVKKEISAEGPSFEESVSIQLKSLEDYLNIHRSKVQLQLKHIQGTVSHHSSTEGRRSKLSEEEHLAQYWAEISSLNDRIDCLIPHLVPIKGMAFNIVDNCDGDKLNKECESETMTSAASNGINDATSTDMQTVSDNIRSSKVTNHKHNDDAGPNRGQQGYDKSSRTPQPESLHKNTKHQQQQLNTRSSSYARANAPNGVSAANDFNNSCDTDDSPSCHNIQRYAFGYNNQLISGSNFYGYPPPYTQQVSSYRSNQVPNYQYQNRGYQSEIKSSWTTAYSSRSYPLCGVTPDFNSPKPLGSMSSATYSNQRGDGSFDIGKDSMPLRYDSPMSPYASYYVYLPVSGLNTENTDKTVSSDYTGDGDNGSNNRDEVAEHGSIKDKQDDM